MTTADTVVQTQLYLISPETIELAEFLPRLEEALSTSLVSVFQLRLKHVSDSTIIAACEVIKPLCHRYGVMFIVNDHPDIAAQVDADGVHLGEEAELYPKARKLLGTEKIIGISCYGSIDRALDYAEQGADYVAFGAFYPTTTKEPKARPDFEIISWWVRNAVVPCVAIGGINAQNSRPLVDAGADFIAVVSCIWNGQGSVAENVTALSKTLKRSAA